MPPGRVASRHALERLLQPERLDRHVDAAPAGEPLDGRDRVLLGEVDHLVGAHLASQVQPLLDAVDADHERGAHQPRAGRGAQADRPLRKDGHGLSDLHVRPLAPPRCRWRRCRRAAALLVGQVVRDLGEVRLRVGHTEVVGLDTVDRVAEPPAADHLPLIAVTGALGADVVLTEEAAAARRDRADEHALPDRVALDGRAELSITPTGSWPTMRPGATGYSPRKICTSVPQIVVSVTSRWRRWGRTRERALIEDDATRALEDRGPHCAGTCRGLALGRD